MCEVSEKIYNEGIKIGEENGIKKSKKETAFSMKEKGCSETFIADILKVGIADVQQWLAEAQ